MSGAEAEAKVGNCLPLSEIPVEMCIRDRHIGQDGRRQPGGVGVDEEEERVVR